MPIYVYKCQECEHLFEEFLPKIPKEGEKIDAVCPQCGSENVNRYFGAEKTDFVLKGRGWAKDLYHVPQKPNPTSSDE